MRGWEFMNSLANCTMLQRISLATNHLEGPIPNSIVNLSNQLQLLYLGENKLSRDFPSGIANLPNLFALGLNDNQFMVELPEWLGTLEKLQYLSFLTLNNLGGHLPASFGNLRVLNSLSISDNFFHGTIPREIFGIPTITKIELSSNNLNGRLPPEVGGAKQVGEVPTKGIFRNATAMRIDGNPELCGGLLELHLLACPIMAVNSSKKHEHSILQKVVIPIASIVSLAIVISVMVFCKGKQKENGLSLPSFGSEFPKVSYRDPARATGGFSGSNLIGKGRYSSVYQAILFQDRTMVAVKVFSLETRGAQKTFIAECNVLRNLRHRNVVPILTACSSIDPKGNDFKALV
uniref:Protein kinase domain-containing protein n=1 Tax=Oryza punctata TaxID=4537 RepID=A0A0E0MG59_ORYPU